MNYSVDWDGPGETDRAQGLIDGAPEPLKRLGERLTDLLDADHWNNIEPLLLEIAAENARLRSALDLICSLEQPMGHSDSNLMAAQRIAEDAVNQQSPSKEPK